MILAARIAAAVLVALALPAFGGALSGGAIAGGSDGLDIWDSAVRCSGLADPAEPEFTLAAENLHDFVTANCSSGCIVNIPPGTYDDVNVTIGPGADARIKAGSLTGATGTILIRGTDPANPPILRGAIGEDSGVFYLSNVDALVRLEDVILDGRKSEQTNAAVYDICPDTTPADGECDAGTQSFSSDNGFHTRRTDGGDSQSCLLRVQVRNTVADGIFLRQPINSTVEDSIVTDAGCTPESCPGISIPADAGTPSLMTVARGINFDTASGNVFAVGNRISHVTKIGVQCITSVDCHLIGNTVDEALTIGASSINSSGSIRGNIVRDTGNWSAQVASSAFVGNGVQWSHASGFSGRDVVIDQNVVLDSFASGIVLALSVGAGASDAEVIVSRNTVSGACLGSDRGNVAAIELGDGEDTIASIWSMDNAVGDHGCTSAIRVQRALDYRAMRNSVSGASTAPAVIYDSVSALEEAVLTVDDDIQIDALSAGSLAGCTLNEGASVVDLSAGAVVRTGGC